VEVGLAQHLNTFLAPQCKISKDLNVILFRVSPNQTRHDEQTETPQKRRQSAEFMELSSLLINNVTMISWIL